MTGLFPLAIPVIGAPMGGGPSTPELAAAVSNAGGLGSLAAAYLSPSRIAEQIARTRALTGHPFAVNLFAPSKGAGPGGNLQRVVETLDRYHRELGLPPPSLPATASENLDDQLEAVLDAHVPAVSLTMGVLPERSMQRLKQLGVYTMGTATTVAEAVELEHSGVDAIVAQGSEAGGHRGGRGLIGTMALVPQIVDATSLPVIASGGIMDGRGIVAALALGAEAAQMGTAFLCCKESGIGDAYRRALLSANEDSTGVTAVFSGKFARGIRNRFMEEWEASGVEPLPFPWQNALTRELRRAAAQAGNSDLQSLWAGQGLRLLRDTTAGELMSALKNEIDSLLTTGYRFDTRLRYPRRAGPRGRTPS